MKQHSIATIVNFCTNESRFIKANLEEASRFSSQIIVPVCDHFFDGRPERLGLLNEIYQAFPEVLFVQYPFVPSEVPKKIFKKISPAHFWHSLSRRVATLFLQEQIEFVLFLDADEIADGKRFQHWLDTSDYRYHTVLKLSNYWYFRDPSTCANETEDSIVLAQKKALDPEILLHEDERDAIFNLTLGPKRRKVVGDDGEPMFHHYSWVRTQDEMLQKVKSWGHHKDRSWEELVKKEFEGPFQGKDFVHNYSYRAVRPKFEIPYFEAPQFKSKGPHQPTFLGKKDLLKLLKTRKFWPFF